jgi:transposase-like protein
MDTEIFLCAEFFDLSRKDVNAIFVDETEIKAGDKLSYGLRLSRRSKLFFFHISWHQNSLDAYYFIIKYGKKPVYTDGTLWYVDACRWPELIAYN